MKYLFTFAFVLICFSVDLTAQIQDTSGIITIETTENKIFRGQLIKFTKDSIFIKGDNDRVLAFSKKNINNITSAKGIKTKPVIVEEKSGLVTVQTKEREYITGELDNITNDSIYITNKEQGRLTFSKSSVSAVHNGLRPPYFTETTNSSVPYYVQTALPNGEGNHYYKNYYIFGNEFNFGLTENFNGSLGFESASLIFGSGSRLPLIQAGMKYSMPVQDNIHVGISSKFYFNGEGSALLINTPITFGGTRTNFTLSPNLTVTRDPDLFGIFLNFSLGLSDRSRFIVDYVHIDDVNMAAILYEFIFKSGFSLSVGAMVAEGAAIPNLSFSIPFGQWKK
jgi:hypothetical protein